MDLEDILSEINVPQKDRYCVIPLHEVFKVVNLVEKSRMVVSRGLEEEEGMGCCSMGMAFQLCMKKF